MKDYVEINGIKYQFKKSKKIELTFPSVHQIRQEMARNIIGVINGKMPRKNKKGGFIK